MKLAAVDWPADVGDMGNTSVAVAVTVTMTEPRAAARRGVRTTKGGNGTVFAVPLEPVVLTLARCPVIQRPQALFRS
jgi:hypothetical protein